MSEVRRWAAHSPPPLCRPDTTEEEPPPPDNPARDDTAASQKRARSDSSSSTSLESLRSIRTLHSEDLHFVHEHGRIYGNDSYFMPCDQAEQDRLALQHQVFTLALKGKLTTTPVTTATKRILDLGTGPGYWAVAMAQQYPHAEVVGIDVAAWDIDATEAVGGANMVTWEVDDLDVWGVEDELDAITMRLQRYDIARDHANREPLDSTAKSKAKAGECAAPSDAHSASHSMSDLASLGSVDQLGWHFSDPYDLIQLRSMKGVFAYWEGVYDEVYKNLTPGGWVEIADYDMDLPNLHAVASADEFPFPALAKLYLGVMQASFKSGRPIGTYYMHPTYLEDAGFKDVSTTQVNVPIGQWPESDEHRVMGKLFLVCLMESLEATLLRLLTMWGDADRLWTEGEVRDMIERGKVEIMDWSRREVSRGTSAGWCGIFKWIRGRKSLHARA